MDETETKWARQRRKVEELCKEIGQDYPDCGFYVGDGWFPVVADALRKIAKVGIPWSLAQVKQKFCQLRIYIDIKVPHEPDLTVLPENQYWVEGHPLYQKYQEVKAIISAAEDKCDRMCESCGADHGLTTPMTGIALCQDCRKEEL